VGKELGRKISLQFTPVSCNIAYLINGRYVGCFPLNDCSCKFVCLLIED
jgi:hypothetical protein